MQLEGAKECSPGTYGLTSDFYKFFWVDIKILLEECIKYSLEKREMSIEHDC